MHAPTRGTFPRRLDTKSNNYNNNSNNSEQSAQQHSLEPRCFDTRHNNHNTHNTQQRQMNTKLVVVGCLVAWFVGCFVVLVRQIMPIKRWENELATLHACRRLKSGLLFSLTSSGETGWQMWLANLQIEVINLV